MTLYKRKNGYYYTHFSIKRRQVHRKLHTKDYNEALRLEAKLKADLFKAIELGELSRFMNITISELIIQYQRQSEINQKKSRDTDNSRFKVFNSFFKPLTHVKSIKIDDIEDLKEYLLDEKEVTTTTVNRYLELLSALFTYAVNHDYLKENICKKVKKYPNKNYTVRYLKDDEEERLFKHLPEYLKPIVRFALLTGLRRTNVLQVQRKQIDFIKNTIDILDNKGNVYLVIPIADKHRDELIELCNNVDEEDYLFKNPKTGYPYSDIRKAFKTALKLADIKNFRFHDLRHTFATRLAMAKVPLITLKELMGHKKIETTMRYTHATDESKREAVNSL